jgi:hypothetical protein
VLGAPSASVAGRSAENPTSVTRGYRLAMLAMLAVLASCGDRGITRDKLQAILWADSDSSRAGASLSQTLYGLRQDLGSPDVVRAVGPTLVLDAGLVGSDLRRFEDAVSAGDWLRAISLYGGPFLEGFYLKDAPEFERWLDAFLRHGLVDLIGQQISGAGGLRPLPVKLTIEATRERQIDTDVEASRAASALDVPLAIRGSVVGSATHFILNARLIDRARPAATVQVTAEGPVDSLGIMVDRVVAQLLVGRAGEGPNRVGDLSRRGLAPLRAYLSGQSAYRNGRFADAVNAFREALERDPDFALAALGLARSGGFDPGGSTWRAPWERPRWPSGRRPPSMR